MSAPSFNVSAVENCTDLLTLYEDTHHQLHVLGCEFDHNEGGDDHGHDHAGGCKGLTDENYSHGLHIAAIFIVLIASLLGTAIPLMGKYVPQLQVHGYVIILGKCAATGVVLAVSMIHMISHSSLFFDLECVPESFRESYEGYAFLFALIAFMVMHALEIAVNEFVSGRMRRNPVSGQALAEDARVGGENEMSAAPVELDDTANKGTLDSGAQGQAERDTNSDDRNAPYPAPDNLNKVTLASPSEDHSAAHGHSHLMVPVAEITPVQRIVSALLMEISVTVHSIFIGLTLGISRDTEVKALIIAIVFHQFFEGVALGSRLADASFQLTFELGLALVFSVSAPVGVAVGMGTILGAGRDFTGPTFVIVEAVFDAVCGGILLYLGCTLLLCDFQIDMRRFCSHDKPHRLLKILGMFAALWVGAAALMLIGKWA